VLVEFSNPPSGYPPMAFTFVFLWKDYSGYPPGKAQLVRGFFNWVLTEGQKRIIEGYMPLPPDLAKIGLEALKEVK